MEDGIQAFDIDLYQKEDKLFACHGRKQFQWLEYSLAHHSDVFITISFGDFDGNEKIISSLFMEDIEKCLEPFLFPDNTNKIWPTLGDMIAVN